MKTRESGMPEESVWEEFFSPPVILKRLGVTSACKNVAELGCGYGTFTIPAARIVSGTVFALDIEQEMLQATRAKAISAELTNIQLVRGDFMERGTGLADACADYVMLFNILHCEKPIQLLGEAYRVLVPGGSIGIIHWNYDPSTPRGPSMDIRPRPEQCLKWAESAGFVANPEGIIDLPPYHYGIQMLKPAL